MVATRNEGAQSNQLRMYHQLDEPLVTKTSTTDQMRELPEQGKEPYSILVSGELNDTKLAFLIDTGANTNIISYDTLFSLDIPVKMEKYAGRLETADGKRVDVIGRAKLHLRLGEIDTDIEALVMHDLDNHMILGLETLKGHRCIIDLDTDQLWTGQKEGSTVPIRIEGPKRLATFIEAVPHDRQMTVHAKEASNGSKIDPNRFDRIAKTAETHIDAHLKDDLKPTSQLEDDVQKILELSAPGVTGNDLNDLRALVGEFRDVFALTNDELGCTNVVEHRIETGDSPPIKIPPRRAGLPKVEIIREEVNAMLDQGIIRPSQSPYSFPVVLVKKKDGSVRVCIDYRKLNDVTIKDAFPIPKIDQSFDALKEAKVFSSMDLASGYWQIPVAPEHCHKTAFVTPDGGLYEYIRMPFGLSNAPGTFQRLMNEVFRDYLYKFILIFLDDVLAYSTNKVDHLEHLRTIFQTLRALNLKLKPKKCKLFQREVVYLSHIIGNGGAKPDPDKVSAVKHWPVPKTVKQIRSFVGFCNYYRRFVRDFAQIARPLTDLTKKDARFEWNSDCQLSFDRLRVELATAPVMQFPRFDCPFIIDTDASKVSLGAVISNVVDGVERPIVYSSRVLTKTEMMYSTTKREALAVIQALKWYKNYIWGLPFIIRTDHASLRWLFRQDNDDDATGMTFRMCQFLQEYNFQVVHRAGSKHANADGLTRRTEESPEWEPGEREEMTGNCPEAVDIDTAISKATDHLRLTVQGQSDETADLEDDQLLENDEEQVSITWTRGESDVRSMQEQDEAISRILFWATVDENKNCLNFGTNLITKDEAAQYGREVMALWGRWNELSIKNGILYRKWFKNESGSSEEPVLQLIVPASGRKEILEQLHDSPVSGGHFAFDKTLNRVRQRFWWPSMRLDIEKRLLWCLPCAARTTAGRKRVAGLQPFKVGIRFHKVAADIL